KERRAGHKVGPSTPIVPPAGGKRGGKNGGTNQPTGRKRQKGLTGLADKLNPGSASSLPVPLLVLGGLGLALVAAGGRGLPAQRANGPVAADASVPVRRLFTIPGRAPFDEVEWEIRDAHIPGKNGPAFEQRNVEFPKFWSQTATNIVAQKYFRGRMSSPERERSVRQMIGRVVTTIGTWGRQGGYFAREEEAQAFEDELKAILVNQMAAFNSPVWVNV